MSRALNLNKLALLDYQNKVKLYHIVQNLFCNTLHRDNNIISRDNFGFNFCI